MDIFHTSMYCKHARPTVETTIHPLDVPWRSPGGPLEVPWRSPRGPLATPGHQLTAGSLLNHHQMTARWTPRPAMDIHYTPATRPRTTRPIAPAIDSPLDALGPLDLTPTPTCYIYTVLSKRCLSKRFLVSGVSGVSSVTFPARFHVGCGHI